MGAYNAPEAARAARAASETTAQIAEVARRFRAVQSGIGAEREASQAVVAQGYRLDTMEAALAESEAALGSAADALQSTGPQAALPHLDPAETQLTRAVASGSGAPALRAENQRRLAEIEARGAAAATQIAEGRRAFDIVDEFAETTWSDIRGNGSEAQAAAGRASEHWELARQGNSMEAQAFYSSREHLDSAAEELDYVNQLIGAIITRLRDLESARDSARGLLDEADRSLKEALAFVRSNDPDVGQGPEAQLREAAERLAAARAEADQQKPDWLRLAAAATEADRLADAALAGARGEAESMQKLRQQAEKLNPLVSGEVNKIARFVNLHGADITPQTMSAVRALVQRFEQAQALGRRAGELEEDERRKTLDQTVAAFAQLQNESQSVYKAAYDDFQRLEQLRADLNNSLAGARSAIDDAEELRSYATHSQGARLREVRQRFDAIRLPIVGEEQIARTRAEAEAIRAEARDIANDIRSRINRPRGGGGVGPVIIAGGWGSSGSWSGGGGSSGPSWGSMGGGGGSFGGGGGGGSFGGGGGGGGW